MADADIVRIAVEADSRLGKYEPIWNWFGYDEPNCTYTDDGKKLLGELNALGRAPARVRAHNLLTSGDGSYALKWGSTNAYSEDEDGNPVYDWSIIDRIFDAYAEAGVIPFVQVGFTPEALSDHDGPYRHAWSLEDRSAGILAGWAAPPNDLGKWTRLVEAWALHLADRYGIERVAAWPWEIWNEPDGSYWTGTVPQFCEMFAATARALKAVLPGVRVGGPHTCGAYGNPRAAAFLHEFLGYVVEHDVPLDFVAFHAKGQPSVVDGHVRMGLGKQLADIETNLAILAEFPSLRGLPVVLGESDPEGCAACSARVFPQNAYRNGPLYGAYAVESLIRTYELSRRAGIDIEGAVTWAFLFDGQPWFDGFRDLATNGIDKAVLNAFRLLGKLDGDWIEARSDGAVPLDAILAEGVRGRSDVNAVATRDGAGISILVWNYHDDDIAAVPAQVTLSVEGLPAPSVVVTEYRMDADHSNAYGAWQRMGSPQDVSPDQFAALEEASRLAVLGSETRTTRAGQLDIACLLPRQGVSLIRIDW